jgi:hypothetical protein
MFVPQMTKGTKVSSYRLLLKVLLSVLILDAWYAYEMQDVHLD